MVQAQIDLFFRAKWHMGKISLTLAPSGSTSGARHNLFIEYCPRTIKAGVLLVGHEIWEIKGGNL